MPDRPIMTALRKLGQRVKAIGHHVGLDLQSFMIIPDLEGQRDGVQMIFTVDPDRVGVHGGKNTELEDLEAMFNAPDTEAEEAKKKERADHALDLAKKLRDPKRGILDDD